MIEPQHPRLSVARQCELVSISRSGFYYQPAGETPLNLALMRLIDVQFLETPWYGSRQMARHLRREGYTVGRKRMRRATSIDCWGQFGTSAFRGQLCSSLRRESSARFFRQDNTSPPQSRRGSSGK